MTEELLIEESMSTTHQPPFKLEGLRPARVGINSKEFKDITSNMPDMLQNSIATVASQLKSIDLNSPHNKSKLPYPLRYYPTREINPGEEIHDAAALMLLLEIREQPDRLNKLQESGLLPDTIPHIDIITRPNELTQVSDSEIHGALDRSNTIRRGAIKLQKRMEKGEPPALTDILLSLKS